MISKGKSQSGATRIGAWINFILRVSNALMHSVRNKSSYDLILPTVLKELVLLNVIENGNSWIPIPVTTPESGPSTALKMTVPSTTEEKICKKNDVKAR
ncbi:hypothetical protein Tco_1087625, partial [Tanacetum coccineum]